MAASVFQRAKAQLVLSDPFYSTILLNLEVIECEKTYDGRDLWMAATNGTQLFVNPKNFEQLSVAQAKGVLKHEVMHIAQLHPWRGHGKEPERFNQAADYAINPIILEEGGELPAGVLNSPAFAGQTAEHIYNQLPPIPKQSNGGNQGRGSQNGHLDHDIMPAKDQSQAAQQQAKAMVSQAAQIAKAMGKLPERIKSMLDELFEPSVDWYDALCQWLTEISPDDYTWARPNRRFIAGDNPMYLPGIGGHGNMKSLGFLIDTSGSMGMDEMKQALGEVAGAVADVKPSRLVVAYCDAAVQHHDTFDQPSEAQIAEKLERHGGGGTNMPAGLKWFKRNVPDVQAVIVLTDGYTPFGEEHDYPFPVLWASTTDIVAPWGTNLKVDLTKPRG